LLNISGADSESTKLEKFHSSLETALLNLEDIRQLSWSGIPVKARAVTWRLLSVRFSNNLLLLTMSLLQRVLFQGYLPANLERRQPVLERKRTDYWNLVKQYYDTERDEVYQDTYRQVSLHFHIYATTNNLFSMHYNFFSFLSDTYRYTQNEPFDSTIPTKNCSRNV
jgi:hypothetical protein